MNDVVLGGIIGIAGSAIGAIIPLIAHFHQKKIDERKSKEERIERLLELAQTCRTEMLDSAKLIREGLPSGPMSVFRLSIFALLHLPEFKLEIQNYSKAVFKCRNLLHFKNGDIGDNEVLDSIIAADKAREAIEKKIEQALNK